MSPSRASLSRLARWIEEADRVVALTGAGVSTESGIPDFRSADRGLWGSYDPFEVASINGFLADPRRFYGFWKERFSGLDKAPPNRTHRLLAELERLGQLRAVVTQNIDGLHQRAGSKRVLEVHGSYRRLRCLRCGHLEDTLPALAELRGQGAPSCERCGGLPKPDVVLFGEALPPSFQESEGEIEAADLVVVLGSSLGVYPVAGLVPLALEGGAKVALINRDPGPMDGDVDLVVHAELRDAMGALGEALSIPRERWG